MVNVQLELGRRPRTCLCVMCHRSLCCVISFFFHMESPNSPAHEDCLSTSSNETKKQTRVRPRKGQGGAKANYCTHITPQHRWEHFSHEPLTIRLTDSGEERLWCPCCGKPVAMLRQFFETPQAPNTWWSGGNLPHHLFSKTTCHGCLIAMVMGTGSVERFFSFAKCTDTDQRHGLHDNGRRLACMTHYNGDLEGRLD